MPSFATTVAAILLAAASTSALAPRSGLNAVNPLRRGHFKTTTTTVACRATARAEDSVVTIEPNYNVAIGSGVLTAASVATQNIVAAVIFGLLTALFAVQTGRVRFTFDNEAMEVFVLRKDEATGETVNASRENFAVGGKNRWRYDTWNSWFFIPSRAFPILFYFSENQTNGPDKGQLHLFPCILNAKQLEDMVVQKVGQK